MAILALGVSHRRAPIELLERLALGDDDYAKAYRLARDEETLHEAVILSTCNRVEVYSDVPSYHGGFLALKRMLSAIGEVGTDELADPLYAHYEDEAVEHLFDVAAGLDSMVIGEPQILQQVRDAHRRARAEDAAGPALAALFHAAARAGRRARAETGIGDSPAGFVETGIALADESFGGLDGRAALVVGAGHMASLAAGHLRSRGLARVKVLNRSPERARALAERTGAEHGGLDQLARALAGTDLVVSATGATGVLITGPLLGDALAGRGADRPMFLLDLAVPRDVDPGAATVPGVRLLDIAGVKHALLERQAGIADDVDRAHAIVAEEVRRFAVRRRSDHLAPLIRALRERGENVMAAELRRHSSRLSSLTPDERAAVEALARGIVSKLLHDPIVRLKDRSASGEDAALARALAELFDIG